MESKLSTKLRASATDASAYAAENRPALCMEAANEIARLNAIIERYQERGHCPSCDGDHL